MVIAPNSDVILLRNVPLDNTYTDTLYFNSAADQYNHFYTTQTYYKKEYNRLTYQRVNSGVLRIQVSADEIYNYNYMMFRNTAYGNKWFYAFILMVEYINDAVAEVMYEIDVMQTYFFDYELEQCYVERETSATDELDEHLLEENIDFGTYKCEDVYTTPYFDDYNIVVFTAYTTVPNINPNNDDEDEDNNSGPDINDEYVPGGPGDTGGE